MRFDTHMHTTFSTDSRMTLAEAKQAAAAQDLGIVITEHMDLAYPEPEEFIFDIDKFFAAYGPQRSDKLLLGIEIGMRDDCVAANRQIAGSHPFDYVIGSIHVIENIDIYHSCFYQTRTKAEVYHQYLNTMITCLEQYDFIDSLGHIDYICRYARFDDPELYFSDFQDDIDLVLSQLAQRDKALEINTRRLVTPDAREALLPVYHRFRELGGRLVTIGSDAHNAQDIGRGMDIALEMAAVCGLTPVYFKERKPIALK